MPSLNLYRLLTFSLDVLWTLVLVLVLIPHQDRNHGVQAQDGLNRQTNTWVVDVNTSNFADIVEQSTHTWLVMFYAPWCGHCKALMPAWIEAARALDGSSVHFAKANVDADQALGSRFGIQGFPTIKVLTRKQNDISMSVTEYSGGRSVSALIRYAKELGGVELTKEEKESEDKDADANMRKPKQPDDDLYAFSADVLRVTSTDMFEQMVLQASDLILVEFYAPWCGHCKSLAPEWSGAATALKGAPVKLAVVDANTQTELGLRYGVQGYPTIVEFPPGKKNATHRIVDDLGARTQEDIINYVYSSLSKHGIAHTMIISEMTSPLHFSECVRQRYCVLLLLPHIVDSGSEERRASVEMFSRVAMMFRTFPASFQWVCAVQQPHLEEYFSLSSGYPSMLIIDKGRARFVKHIGIFEESALVHTIRALQNGFAKPTSMKTTKHDNANNTAEMRVMLPDILSVDAWDDGVPVQQDG